VLHVPGDYDTIQEAVDAAGPFDKIELGPGEYAGAYIQRPVIIEGSGPETRITAANEYPFWPGEDAFDIFGRDAWSGYCLDYHKCGADGTQIRNLTIDGEGGAFFWGVYFLGADGVQVENATIAHAPWSVYGEVSDHAVITDLEITDSYQGIGSWGGNGWTIEDNTLVGVEMAPGSGAKHADMVLLAAHGSGHLIRNNTIHFEGDALCTGEPGSTCGPEDDERYVGIGLVAWDGPMEDNTVVDNEVVIQVEGDDINGQCALWLVDYSLKAGGSALVQENEVYDNVLIGGINYSPPALAELNEAYDNTY